MRVSEFQRHIAELYLEKDRRRGEHGTVLWLIEEVGELTEAVRRKEVDLLADELADLLAWTASLANLHGIDLEAAIARKYPDKCKRCGAKPCACAESGVPPL